MILIVDFGSQSTHLIARRCKELSISTHIIEPEQYSTEHGKYADGIILSGGPHSVYDTHAPQIPLSLLECGKPVLGICYGQQLIAQLLGGKVEPGSVKEFGPARITITKNSPLFSITTIPNRSFIVWMSHGDQVTKLPLGFTGTAQTDSIPYAGFEHQTKKIFGIQFHPELLHTQFGFEILSNFCTICNLKPKKQHINNAYVHTLVSDIKDSVGSGRCISAFSGGVDSTVASLLVHRAIGNRLTPIYIDSGLMREGETEELTRIFSQQYAMKVRIIHAEQLFLKSLRGVTDPEMKRKIIGKVFIDVLQKEAKKIKAKFLVQGTIYPDVIESSGTKHSDTIKSHHNVGGLPPSLSLTLLEPLRTLYKDEVRRIGKLIQLPKSITHRQPFPGPGLAIRIIGEVTKDKLNILRQADKIVTDEIRNMKLTEKIWQTFAVFTGIKTTGVRGDNRAYGETIAIRAIESTDTMSAQWARLPYTLLEKISVRITNEIPTVNRVVYDITNKPPSTMEWE